MKIFFIINYKIFTKEISKAIHLSRNYKIFRIIMAVTNKKILNFAIVDKGLKTDNFLKFIKKIHRSDKENKYKYLIYNASIHRTKKFMKYVR